MTPLLLVLVSLYLFEDVRIPFDLIQAQELMKLLFVGDLLLRTELELTVAEIHVGACKRALDCSLLIEVEPDFLLRVLNALEEFLKWKFDLYSSFGYFH